MAVYAISGKLGSGKTLACIHRMHAALLAGRVVATNIDLRLSQLPHLRPGARVIRVPDHPTLSDFELLGRGYPASHKGGYDESQFGLLVLDECGTWFNAREWNDKGRREMLSWLVHARKLGWDVYLIIQDVDVIDKQARKSVIELVARCTRMDRMGIPGVTFLLKQFGLRLPLPRLHIARVRYGLAPNAPISESWTYRGDLYFGAYDTTQVYRPDYPHGPYSVLGAEYRRRAPRTAPGLRRLMRLTKLAFRRHSRTALIAAGMALGAASLYAFGGYHGQGSAAKTAPIASHAVESPKVDPQPQSASILAYSSVGGVDRYRIKVGARIWSDASLKRAGYQFHGVGPCYAELRAPTGARWIAECDYDAGGAAAASAPQGPELSL